MVAVTVDPILEAYSDDIESFAYVCYGGHVYENTNNFTKNTMWLTPPY